MYSGLLGKVLYKAITIEVQTFAIIYYW